MKEKLEGILGGFGAILWYFLSIVYSFAPLFILHFPWWLDGIIIFIILFVPFVGEIVRIVLYIWAFIVVLNGPMDVVAIVFFVVFAIYALAELLPLAVTLFSSKKSSES